MKLKLKRTLAFVMAFMMSISSVAFADGIKVGTDGKGTTPVLVEQEATNFDVVIPLTLPVEMNGNGVVTTSNNAKILNKSFGPIQVKNIELQNKAWKLIKFDSDLSKLKVDSKQIGFKIGTDATTDNGAFKFTQQDNYIINGGKDKAIDYNAILSPVRNKVEDINAIDTIFTIDWYEEEQVAPVVSTTYKVGDKLTKTLNVLGDFDFTCVEVDDTNDYFICDKPIDMQTFNSDRSKGNDYSTSELKTYVDSLGVEGLTIPSIEQLQKWYSSNRDRIAQYNGNDAEYWTNSAYPTNVGLAYCVRGNGAIDISDVRSTLGVRPCFAIAKGGNAPQDEPQEEKYTGPLRASATLVDGSKVDNLHYVDKTTDATNYGWYDEDNNKIDKSKIKEMKVEGTAPENCSYMFGNYTELTKLDLSNFDTSNVVDVSSMFNSCRNLTSLDVSKFNTSKVTDMSGMFYRCAKLTSLDVSNFGTSNVTNMSNMFAECTNLTSLDVSNFDTSNVTNMYAMFSLCTDLTSLNVSNFNTSNVTNMGAMFNGCTDLTSLNVSNFDTSKVTSMSIMFSQCKNLTSLNVSNFDTSNVTSMSSMFWSCTNLTTLDLSNFDTGKVASMSEMFGSCTNLTTLDLSNFDTGKVVNMKEMFESCKNLTTLDLSNFDTSKVTNMSDMFKKCINLAQPSTNDQKILDAYNNR